MTYRDIYNIIGLDQRSYAFVSIKGRKPGNSLCCIVYRFYVHFVIECIAGHSVMDVFDLHSITIIITYQNRF